MNLYSWQPILETVVGKSLGALLVLILGMVLGSWAKTIVVRGLGALKLDSLVKDTKFKVFMKNAEIGEKLEEVLGSLVKWVIVLVFFIAATNILGLTTVSQLLSGIIGYIPSVVSAVIVLALGVLLAGLVETLVKGALASIDLQTSRLMGKIASYTIVSITVLAAFSELKIATEFISILFIGFVSMIALGLGLAIGLGGKDLISRILNDWYDRLQKDLKKK